MERFDFKVFIKKYFLKWKLLSSFSRFVNLSHLQWGLAVYNLKLMQKLRYNFKKQVVSESK